MNANIRPEVQLLLWAASPNGQSRELTRAQGLLEQDLDWEYVLNVGLRNGILPLLYWHLNTHCAERVPPVILIELQAFFRQTSLRNLLLTNELARLVALFTRHGISVLPYKGPLLALWLYGNRNLALRSICDLDILVEKRDLPAVKEVLVNDGYRLDVMSAKEERSLLESDYCLSFIRQEGDVHVEIHWDVLPRRSRQGSEIGYLWNRLSHSSVAGQPMLALPPEDVALLLCIHGHKHGWQKLKCISDIGQMIATHEDIDWSSVMRRAESLKQGQALLLGCSLARLLLAVRLPDQVHHALNNNPSVTARAGLLCGRIFWQRPGLPGFGEWIAYVQGADRSLGEVGRSRMFLRYLSAVMTPEETDWDSLALPRWLSFLYYVYRPIRLLSRHRITLLKRVA